MQCEGCSLLSLVSLMQLPRPVHVRLCLESPTTTVGCGSCSPWSVSSHFGQLHQLVSDACPGLQPISCWMELQWPVDNAHLYSVSLVQLQRPVDNAHLSSVSLVQLQRPMDNAHLSPVSLAQLQ